MWTVAFGTDGTACLPGHADYDGDPLNGCEAVSDTAAGEPFRSRIVANLVPADAVDEIPFTVDHSLNLFCDNVLKAAPPHPAGATMRLDASSEGRSSAPPSAPTEWWRPSSSTSPTASATPTVTSSPG